MATLQIKRETLPVRCEICHQTDCFDPLSNSCSRCAAVVPVTGHTLPHTRIEVTIGEPEPQRLPVTGWVQIRAVVSWVVGFLFIVGMLKVIGWVSLPFPSGVLFLLQMLHPLLRLGFEKYLPNGDLFLNSLSKKWRVTFIGLAVLGCLLFYGCLLSGTGGWVFEVSQALCVLLVFAFWCFSIYYDLRHFFLRHPDSES